MARLLFWDNDTLVDFLDPEGKRHIPGAEQIRPRLKRLTDFAHQRNVRILASAGDPQQKVPETSLRNPLVVEPGHQDPAAIGRRALEHAGDILVHKHGFDIFSNPNTIAVVRALDPQVIVMYGVSTDLSDQHSIEGLAQHRPHTRIYFVTDAACAINPGLAEHLLKEWAEEGVRLVKAEEILEGGVLDAYLTA